MAGALGWAPSELRSASLAEIWSCWIGYARAQGWIRDEGPEPPTMAEIEAMLAEHPDT